MFILDCESYESTLTSISNAYEVDKDKLIEFLEWFDMDRFVELNVYLTASQVTQKAFEHYFNEQVNFFDGAYWFHLSRTSNIDPFKDGVLPLRQSEGLVWKVLFDAVGDEAIRCNLAKLHRDGVPDSLYQMRTANAIHHGPYAMLVKDAAFSSGTLCNHDYLGLPELVEDICNGYKIRYGHEIHEYIQSCLSPCVVKFFSEKRLDDDLIGVAMVYAWCKANDHELFSYANTCIDMAGNPVGVDRISKIEFLTKID